MKVLLCCIIGHKWRSKVRRDEMEGGQMYRYTHVYIQSHCLRCGEPNPGFNMPGEPPARPIVIPVIQGRN